MRIDLFIVALLVFGVVVFVGFSLFGAHISEYNIENADEDLFAGTHNDLTKIFAEQKSFEDKISGESVEDDDAESSMFAGGFKAVRGVYSSLTIAGNVSQTIVKEASFGDEQGSNVLPTIFNTFMIILAVLVSFTILAYIFRFMPR